MVWPFAKKHPFPLTRLTKEGRANRKEVLKELCGFSFILPHVVEHNLSLPFTVNVGKDYHLLRLENIFRPPKGSEYDWHGDVIKLQFDPLDRFKASWYLVGRVRFNLLEDKIASIDLTHMAAKKVVQGASGDR